MSATTSTALHQPVGKKAAAESGRPRKSGRILIRTVSMAVTIILFTLLIFLAAIIPHQRLQLIDELHKRAFVIQASTAQVLEDAISLDDFSVLVDHCINVVKQSPSLRYLVITPKEGPSLIHTPNEWRQEELGHQWRPDIAKEPSAGVFTANPFGQGELFHITYPFDYIGQNWGWIHLGLSLEKFQSDLHSLYLRSGMIATVAFSAGLILSLFYARKLSIPIQKLAQFARRIASGDLEQRIDIRTGDEMEHLAQAINDMVEELQSANLERENTQKKLVEAARHAGMAEMVSNVLHNVGNVLNSVGVTTSSMKHQLAQSKNGSLAQLAGMMRDQGDNLADYLTLDPRGQKIPAYLASLSEHLASEHQNLITQVADLERHVEHVRDIIHLQQDYSKTRGLTEYVDIKEVIEDALRLNRERNVKFDIKVHTSYAPMPACRVDRHRLLQILINLVSNARHALAVQEQSPRMIHIKLEQLQPNRIRITVADNGIGVEPHNLTRIFQHGFTTRKDGHGFGLHSSAIAARDLSGSLTVSSEGAGKGATFVIEFPFRPKEESHAVS